MTACTCDLHSSATTSTALTVSNTGGGTALQVNGSTSGTALNAIYVAGNSSTYGIFSEGTSCAILGKSYVSYTGTGVKGQAAGFSGGYGVWGESTNNYGYGIYGTSPTGGGGAGVYGSGWAGLYGIGGTYGLYCVGAAYVSGYLTKAGGGFTIDHPVDPENKFLVHGFVEAPVMTNVYRGKVTLDANGTAEITLPGYYDATNENGDVTCSPVGQAMPGLFPSEVVNGKFTLVGGVAGGKVNWTLLADRADKWAKENQPGTEVSKKEHEKGKFMHPHLFGHDDTRSLQHLSGR
jgi:hypothetical protein